MWNSRKKSGTQKPPKTPLKKTQNQTNKQNTKTPISWVEIITYRNTFKDVIEALSNKQTKNPITNWKLYKVWSWRGEKSLAKWNESILLFESSNWKQTKEQFDLRNQRLSCVTERGTSYILWENTWEIIQNISSLILRIILKYSVLNAHMSQLGCEKLASIERNNCKRKLHTAFIRVVAHLTVPS